MLQETLQKWTDAYLEEGVKPKWQYLQEGQRHEIEEGLYSVFEDVGVEGFMETGTAPDEYLPAIISTALQLLQVNDWSLGSVSSSDDWITADVSLEHMSDQVYEFTIHDNDDSDWLSFDVFTQLNQFARTHADLSLLTICSDDPYRVLTVPHQGLEEFEKIMQAYAVPYE